MQQEAIEVGELSPHCVRPTEQLTPGSAIGNGAVHYREGGLHYPPDPGSRQCLKLTSGAQDIAQYIKKEVRDMTLDDCDKCPLTPR